MYWNKLDDHCSHDIYSTNCSGFFIFLAYADTILQLSGFDYFLVISASRSLSQLLVIYTDFHFFSAEDCAFRLGQFQQETISKISRSREIEIWCLAHFSDSVMQSEVSCSKLQGACHYKQENYSSACLLFFSLCRIRDAKQKVASCKISYWCLQDAMHTHSTWGKIHVEMVKWVEFQ